MNKTRLEHTLEWLEKDKAYPQLLNFFKAVQFPITKERALAVMKHAGISWFGCKGYITYFNDDEWSEFIDKLYSLYVKNYDSFKSDKNPKLLSYNDLPDGCIECFADLVPLGMENPHLRIFNTHHDSAELEGKLCEMNMNNQGSINNIKFRCYIYESYNEKFIIEDYPYLVSKEQSTNSEPEPEVDPTTLPNYQDVDGTFPNATCWDDTDFKPSDILYDVTSTRHKLYKLNFDDGDKIVEFDLLGFESTMFKYVNYLAKATPLTRAEILNLQPGDKVYIHPDSENWELFVTSMNSTLDTIQTVHYVGEGEINLEGYEDYTFDGATLYLVSKAEPKVEETESASTDISDSPPVNNHDDMLDALPLSNLELRIPDVLSERMGYIHDPTSTNEISIKQPEGNKEMSNKVTVTVLTDQSPISTIQETAIYGHLLSSLKETDLRNLLQRVATDRKALLDLDLGSKGKDSYQARELKKLDSAKEALVKALDELDQE